MGDDALAARLDLARQPQHLGVAADHGDVRLRDVAAAAVEDVEELEPGGQPHVAAADRHALAGEGRVARDVVQRQRRLEPRHAAFAEQRQQRNALLGALPRRRRVDHQVDAGAHVIARRADQPGCRLQVVGPVRIGDDLDGAQPHRQGAIEIDPRLVRRSPQRVDRAVGLDAVAPLAAQQLDHRLALGLALDVPQRDVDAADGVDRRAAPAEVVGRVVHAVPQPFDVAGVLAEQHRAQAPRLGVGDRRLDDGAHDRGLAVDLGDAGDAGVGMDAHDAVVPTAVVARAVPARHAQLDDLDARDFHDAPAAGYSPPNTDQPPSITMVCPVIQAPAGPASSTATPAMSSGSPSRPSG